MSNFRNTTQYQDAYNGSVEEESTVEKAIKLGSSDGKRDVRTATREAAGRVKGVSALERLQQSHPHLFEQEEEPSAEESADSAEEIVAQS
jgi:hypothetical protein